jgi:hypothetical protein
MRVLVSAVECARGASMCNGSRFCSSSSRTTAIFLSPFLTGSNELDIVVNHPETCDIDHIPVDVCLLDRPAGVW